MGYTPGKHQQVNIQLCQELLYGCFLLVLALSIRPWQWQVPGTERNVSCKSLLQAWRVRAV